MRNTAIQIEAISKQYRIGVRRAWYKTMRETVSGVGTAAWQAIRSKFWRTPDSEEAGNLIWALKDVSFEVQEGETVGIIGGNGAGKSTLLKILSRITEPTSGQALIRGHVASLLEVGTGFHSELSGRENIFLNGAILGMRRSEIARKFDEIVEFAGVEKFIDTPVKHYSSGMYLRLAFAVAAHLEPEILLVDEVLAVGDAAFQRKCLGKMRDVATQGRTVLFVSHNLGAVKELCQTSVVLKDGRLVYRGSAAEGIAHYTRALVQGDEENTGGHGAGWTGVRISRPLEDLTGPIDNSESFAVEAQLNLSEAIEEARLFCIVDDSGGSCVLHHFINSRDFFPDGVPLGRVQIRVEFPPLWLVPDVYTLHFKLISKSKLGRDSRYISERIIVDITDSSGQMDGHVKATLIPPLNWSIGRGDKAFVPDASNPQPLP